MQSGANKEEAVITIEDLNPAYTYTVTSYSNEDGSRFADVNIRFANGDEENHSFSDWFDSPGESVDAQVGAFLDSLYDITHHTLEELLGPYGIEWEREQEDRYSYR